jgi:molybdopterin-containing oxidoreductase family membrane subunit
MRAAVVLAVTGIVLLIIPSTRKNEKVLAFSAAAIFAAAWIDKGMGLVVGGFVPNPFEEVVEYAPTAPELLITLAVWAIGFLVLTVLYKVAISVKEEAAA